MTAIVGCVSEGKEEENRSIVDSFVEWCATNHLHLNPTKTKELVVDFRRRKSSPTPISINGVTVDVVQDYNYLGAYLDNKLDWAKNTKAVYKKGQGLYFLRRLRSFNVCIIMLKMFYQSMVAVDPKLHSILDNNAHPLHQVPTASRSTFSNRLIPPRCNTECFWKSFLPVAIRLYNSSTSGR